MSKGGSSIPSDYTIKLGSDGSTIHIDTDLDNIQIKDIAPVTVNSNLAVTQPIVTQSSSKSDSTANLDLKIEPLDLKVEPLQVTTDSTIDVKPLAVDSCQTIKLAPLPPIRMEQPYSTHFGFTFLGMELFGFTMSGKSEMFLDSPPKPQYHTVNRTESPAEAHRSGLRVRVMDVPG